MLHRLTLRILPQLSLAVTEPDIRSRKRWVMFVIGFVAFGLYRLAKALVPLGDPIVLLAVAGGIGAVTAGTSYVIGRRAEVGHLMACETPRRWMWLLGWVGGVYGVQLALLVLALLQLGVNYDFLQHPDGPAMMAIIISCTAVARDAVELGHLRWLESQGRSFLTFPDGTSLRALLRREPAPVLWWGGLGLALCASVASGMAWLLPLGGHPMVQLGGVTLLGGSLALCAYLDGMSRPRPWWIQWRETSWWELMKFWWWPGLAFAATYFLVVYGAGAFVFRVGAPSAGVACGMAASVGLLMGVYSYYLGARRSFENRVVSSVPASMLRCPFITGILGAAKGQSGAVPPEAVSFAGAPHPVRMERVP